MSNKTIVVAAMLALTAGLGACATATPYQPFVKTAAASGGYAETRLEPNRWRVTFSGNSLTSRETVEGYLLFRAAELTLQNGDDWFAIADRSTDRQTRTYVDPDPLYSPWYGVGYSFWRPSWRYAPRGFGWQTWDPLFGGPFSGGRVNVRTFDRFEASAEIVTSKGAKPADDPRAFDARAVAENLKARIQYPAPPK